ncbi:MAG: transcriptional repressor [Acidimicrobiales bacterium]|jgi:Fur family transcriptional regulator, ferric uptake regulator
MAIEQGRPESEGSESVDPVELVLAELRRRGGRVTSTRRLLLRALFERSGHRTAPELAEDLAREVKAYGLEVHMSTIYRFLDELEELGVVSHSHLGHGPAVYDVSPVGHFHLVCEVCGEVTESPDALLAALARSLKARCGFSIDAHHFAIAGRCRNCSE